MKAARVRFSFEHHDKLGKGSYALDGMMIDAPVYKQVNTYDHSVRRASHADREGLAAGHVRTFNTTSSSFLDYG
jgi:citrate lyase beta subunit